MEAPALLGLQNTPGVPRSGPACKRSTYRGRHCCQHTCRPCLRGSLPQPCGQREARDAWARAGTREALLGKRLPLASRTHTGCRGEWGWGGGALPRPLRVRKEMLPRPFLPPRDIPAAPPRLPLPGPAPPWGRRGLRAGAGAPPHWPRAARLPRSHWPGPPPAPPRCRCAIGRPAREGPAAAPPLRGHLSSWRKINK